MKISIFYLNILVFIVLFAVAKIEAVEVAAFEHTYNRGTGTPVKVTNTFSGANGLATIRVLNGGLEDADNERVSSSEITLNGEVIIDASNFNQNVGFIEVEINLFEGINTIDVTLKGKPGGALTVQVITEAVDLDGDGYNVEQGDCNDNDANEYPGQTWYKDEDNDSYSDGTTDTLSCLRPLGYKAATELTATTGDCNDGNASLNPGLIEIPYNIKDDDCNPVTLDDDLDGDGFIIANDCNDNDSSIFPGATETPYDGIDQDCDGSDLVDADGDGHDAEQAEGDDCNDNDNSTFPGAPETPYDGIDQDCDGSDLVDVDGDGYSAEQVGGDDCDDSIPNIHPDATDVYENGIDEDCDGHDAVDPNNIDDDGDNFTEKQGDCDDTNPDVNPDATELLDNGIDDNCNGEVDEDLVPPTITITSPTTFTTVGVSQITVTGTVDDPAATVTVNGVNATVGSGVFNLQDITLTEGGNTITATAIDPANNVSTAHVTIYMDSTPPKITINTPVDGYVSTTSTVTITGTIFDIVKGTVNEENAAVEVNGFQATVSNKTFIVEDLVLVEGENTITATVADQVGNTASADIMVFVDTSAQKKINMVSGNNQTATINTKLTSPFLISLTNEDGTLAEGETVIFKITRNNGILEGISGSGQVLAETTDANGQASVFLTTGSRSGVGNNHIEAYSVGFEGDLLFTASSIQSAPNKINIGSGNNQRGAISMPLPNPLVAVVTDVGHNVIKGVPVTFTVTGGGGAVNGSKSVVVNTDSDGRVTVSFALGDEEGLDNHIVKADFDGIATGAAIFRASGFVTGDPGDTRISGVVMDNSNVPIPGVTLRVDGTTREAVSDNEGQFLIENVPVGPLHLIVDGSTATVSGEYPELSFEVDTISGQNNTLGMPIYLLPLNTTNTQYVGGSEDVVYELENIPGFSLNIKANSVTFPDGSHDGFISVTQVHADKAPMAPPNGLQPRLIITIQPPDAVFDPPAPITIPNVDGLAPGEITEMYSFDHDLGQFVSIGTGTVSDDGMVLASDPGVGIIKAGWHCGGNPATADCLHNCPVCQKCELPECECRPDNDAIGVEPCYECVNGKQQEKKRPTGWDDPHDCKRVFCGGEDWVIEPDDREKPEESCDEYDINEEIGIATNLLNAVLAKLPLGAQPPAFEGELTGENCPVCCNGSPLDTGIVNYGGFLQATATLSYTYGFKTPKYDASITILNVKYGLKAGVDAGLTAIGAFEIKVDADGKHDFCEDTNCFTLQGCGKTTVAGGLTGSGGVDLTLNDNSILPLNITASGTVKLPISATASYYGCDNLGLQTSPLCIGDVTGDIIFKTFGITIVEKTNEVLKELDGNCDCE